MATIVRRRPTARVVQFTEPAPPPVAAPKPQKADASVIAPEFKSALLEDIDTYLMTINKVSAYVGLPKRTISIYHGRGNMPKPDLRLGQTPLWFRDTIDTWEETRPKRTQNSASA